MTTALSLKSRIALLLAALLVTSGLSVSMSTSAHAGTADYQYTCSQPGQSPWVIAKGQPLSLCKNGYIYERLNGELKRTIPTNEAGARQTKHYTNKQAVDCIVAVAGGVVSVIGAGGVVGWIGVGTSLYGIANCKA